MTNRHTGAELSTTPARTPKTRQRKHKAAPSLDVPDINEDAPERKRVLNVLAQRRYRQRKRQQNLAQASPGKQHLNCSKDAEPSTSNEDVPPESEVNEDALQDDASEVNVQSCQLPAGDSSETTFPTLGIGLQEPWLSNVSEFDLPLEVSGIDDIEIPLTQACQGMNMPRIPTSDCFVESSISTISPEHLSSSTSSSDTTATESSYSSPSAAAILSTTPLASFPDTWLLPMPELKLLRAFLRLSESIQCKTSIWDLDATSPFLDATYCPTSKVHQTAWAPTVSQRTVAHHPIVDMLPWASARDRLLTVLNLPDEFRPPGLVGPTALVQFAYDLEDSAEGMRIWGETPCDASVWEVGQVLFQRWWFLFDRHIIAQSNYWRTLRGAPLLRVQSADESVTEVRG